MKNNKLDYERRNLVTWKVYEMTNLSQNLSFKDHIDDTLEFSFEAITLKSIGGMTPYVTR